MGIKKELDEIEITCPFCGNRLSMLVVGNGEKVITIQDEDFEVESSDFCNIETFCHTCLSKIVIETQGDLQ